jgi:hypothetical protein
VPEVFDETLLDDEAALERADPVLRPLAEAGARVRREWAESAEAVEACISELHDDQPRAVVAAGPDSRLLRAVLEPTCPVPFVAWPAHGLPGWAGPLDLVVMLAPQGHDPHSAATVAEAVRRGCQVVVAAPEGSLVAQHSSGRHCSLLPTVTGDQLASAVVMLDLLFRVGLGPAADAEQVATALDDVAVSCSPHRDQTVNPAKLLAASVADSVPLFWGGSVLAARAARRIAEAFRRASGRSALAGDAEHLLPIIGSAAPRDVFDDPFADDSPVESRPALVVLDDGVTDAGRADVRDRLSSAADERQVRVEVVSSTGSTDVARYASLLGQGRYAAAYVGVGLGRNPF